MSPSASVISPTGTVQLPPSPPLSRRRSSAPSISASSVSSAASSATSLYLLEGEVDVVAVDGVRHASMKLTAKKYKSTSFAVELLEIINILRVPSWSDATLTGEHITVKKVTGSYTNAVFFVSCTIPQISTLLLRIYGPASGSLISRPRELQTLHILSSEYNIGPHVFGTFDNGRIEEYFPSVTLTSSDIRDKTISRWIGARMAELHSVDVEGVEQTVSETQGEAVGWEIGAKKNLKLWIQPAREVLKIPSLPEAIRKELDLDDFKAEWDRYMAWISLVEKSEGQSRRVFAHNDTQPGNLLRLTKLDPELPEHRQLIVVDFEYASPNPAAFDIANHFNEWTADYGSSTPFILDPSLYPTYKERMNFYLGYFNHASSTPLSRLPDAEVNHKFEELDRQVRIWSPASHAIWAVWGIVQAREDLENDVEQLEFDNIAYARCRMSLFRQGVAQLLM